MKRTAVLITLVLLSGCVEAELSPPEIDDSCGAARFQGLTGQPKSVLTQMNLPAGTRVIGPNQPVTMDFRPARMNIEIGPDDRISRISCY